MYDYGWLSSGWHQDSLIWLNLLVLRCAASEPCWLLLPIRAQWADVPARTPLRMPDPGHCWQWQTRLSSPIRLEFPSIAACAGSVSGESKAPSAQGSQALFSSKKTQACLILPLPHFPGRACIEDCVLKVLLVTIFFFHWLYPLSMVVFPCL